MELPDLPLALVREFSRPRVSKEARDEYAKVGDWPDLKRVMVTPHAIAVVRAYNDQAAKVESIYVEYRKVHLLSARAGEIRDQLDVECPILWRHVRNVRELIRVDKVMKFLKESHGMTRPRVHWSLFSFARPV